MLIDKMAERVGFEPTVRERTLDFESSTFGLSATSPFLQLKLRYCLGHHNNVTIRTLCTILLQSGYLSADLSGINPGWYCTVHPEKKQVQRHLFICV
jgi:hypothetical protein